jgi:hypothetical protein
MMCRLPANDQCRAAVRKAALIEREATIGGRIKGHAVVAITYERQCHDSARDATQAALTTCRMLETGWRKVPKELIGLSRISMALF